MIIGVKFVNSETGEVSGKEYSYYANEEYEIGESIKVPTARGEADAVVTRLNIPEEEVEPIKGFMRTIGEAPKPSAADEIELKMEATLPVVKTNFAEIKKNLTESLKKYENLVVTEETLPGCKATQKELAGLRIKVDSYRKEKTKELSKPIDTFVNECKELIALIEKVEIPIKEGIGVFDDKKRDKQREVAESIRKEVIAEIGLEEKYASQLTVIDKYTNLTAKKSDVKNDLTGRAFALKVEQDREAELLEIIEDTVDSENKRLNSKMALSDFQRYIDRGYKAAEVIAEIKTKAESIYAIENPPAPPEPTPEPTQEPEEVKEPAPEPVAEKAEEATYWAAYRITGTKSQLKGVSAYLKENSIIFKVTDQGEVDG